MIFIFSLSFFFKSSPQDIFSFLLERGEGREEGREKHRCRRGASFGCLPYAPRLEVARTCTGDQTHNVGMCPEWELNPQHCSYRMTLQPTEPHWPRLSLAFIRIYETCSLGEKKCSHISPSFRWTKVPVVIRPTVISASSGETSGVSFLNSFLNLITSGVFTKACHMKRTQEEEG